MNGQDAQTDRLRAIGAFLVVFTDQSFKFGSWDDPRRPDGSLTLPHYELSPEASAFVEAAYAHGWVLDDFDWVAWRKTREAKQLMDGDELIARASTQQLAQLLTACIRAERFCDGALQQSYQSGLLLRIVRRASAILKDL